MVAILICGHGHFASGVASSLSMIAGEQEAFVALDFTNDNAGSFADELKSAILDLQASFGQVAVFCDLMGGTPFNQAMLISAELEGVEVIAGTSLPVLLEALMTRDGDATAKEVAEVAVEVGKMSVVNPELSRAVQNDIEDIDLDGGI